MHDAFICASLSFAIAAPRCLQDAVQPGDFAPDRREIHIHARFDQAGGNHAARFPGAQPRANFIERPFPVARSHQRRKMIAPLFRQQFIQLSRAPARADDAERRFLPGNLLRKRGCRHPALPSKRHAAKEIEQPVRVGRDFANGKLRRSPAEKPRQRRLRRGTEHGRRTVMPHKLGDGENARLQIRQRHRLRLVENNHAVRNVMQLTAARGFRRVKRFEELHRRRHDNRRVPVFTRKSLAKRGRFFRALRVVRKIRLAVMLQHVLRAQNLLKRLRVLLDNARIRDHIDHAPHVMRGGVRQRKSERGNRLPAARRHGERVEPPFGLSALQAMREDFASARAKRVFRLLQPWRNLRAQLFQQRFDRFIPAARLRALHRGLGINKIRVHQTGKEHARIHRPNSRFAHRAEPRWSFHPLRQRDFAAPCRRIVLPRQFLSHARHKRAVLPIAFHAQIRQAAVMAGDRQSRGQIAQLQVRFLRPGRRVIGFRRMLRVALTRLTARAVFADIVQKPRTSGLLLRAERRAVFRRQPRNIFHMFAQRLKTPVLSSVRDKLHGASSFRSVNRYTKRAAFCAVPQLTVSLFPPR